MYTKDFEKQVKKWAKQNLSKERYKHTKRVVKTVTCLAEIWSPDEVRLCRIAAWIHDTAKQYDDNTLYQMARDFNLEISSAEADNPMLLHGAVGYEMAAREFGLDDDAIRTACAYHTTGHPTMNLVDKLLCLADLIEPKRDFPTVDRLRELCEQDLDTATLFAVVHTLCYLQVHGRMIDPRVVELYNVLIRAGVTIPD